MNATAADMRETARMIRALMSGNLAVKSDAVRLNGHAALVETLIEARRHGSEAFWKRLGPILDADSGLLKAVLFPTEGQTGAEESLQWYWENELHRLRRPKMLIEHRGMALPDNALTLLVGAPGVGKTFLALDVGLAVAQQDYVLYIAAEKSELLRDRVVAWYQHWLYEPRNNLRVLDGAVNFLSSGAVTQLIDETPAAGRWSRLVIIDTLARCLPGDENSSWVMHQFLESCERIRRAFACALLVVHHPVKDTKSSDKWGRGHSSCSGSATAIYTLSKADKAGALMLENPKQNGAPERPPVYLRLQKVTLTADSVTGKVTESSVIALVNGKAAAPKIRVLDSEQKLLKALEATDTGVEQKALVAETGLAQSTVSNVLRSLCERGLALKTEGKPPLCQITSEGKTFLGALTKS